MKPQFNRFLAVSTVAAAVFSSAAFGQTKADNTNVLNLGTSWTGGSAPTASSVAEWSGTYNTAGSLSASFTANTPVSWQGITIGNISGTAAGLVSIGGTGAAVTGSSVTIGTSGIDMSAANQNLVINAATLNFNSSQTWNTGSGRNLRLGASGTGAANANVDGNSATAVITVSGGGVADMNQGGVSGFADGGGFAHFTGKWQVNTGATLRGLRNGGTAWGTNTAADAITLNGGTLAVGGVSGTQGNWTWNTPVTLAASTTSAIDQQIFTGTGRFLKLMGAVSGTATTNLIFKETGANNSFSSDDLGYIIAVNNPDLAGTVTIWGDGATENNIVGRLSSVRVGGVNGATDTTTGAGNAGTLGTAAVVNNGVLTLSRNDTWTFGNAVSGTGSLRIGGGVSGAGTQVVTVSGTNTYTGATTVALGRLNLTGSLTSAVSVSANAKIAGNGSTTGLLTLAANSGVVLAGGGTTTGLTANGVTITSPVPVTFDTAPIAGNVYDVLTYGTGTVTGDPATALKVQWRGSVTDVPASQKYIFTAGAAGTRTWNTTDGDWEQGVDTNFAEGDMLFYGGDTAIFNNPAIPSTVTLWGALAPAAMTVNNVNGYTFSGSGSLTGAMTLTKTGTGSLTLNTANSYTGGTTLSQGTIVVGNNNALGTSGTITINDTGTGANNTGLYLDATAGNVTLARPIIVANEGSGTVTLGNASTANTNQAIFSGAITLNKAVTLMNSAFGDRLQFSGGISGTGDVTVDGASNTRKTVFIGAANTFNGNIHVTANGRLQLSDGSTSTSDLIPDTSSVNLNASGAVFNLAKNGNNETIDALNGVAGSSVNGVAGNDTLTVGNNSGSGAFAGTVTGSVGITKAGAGTQELSGTNSFTGAIQVNGGTLTLSGSTTTTGNLNSLANTTVNASGSAINFASGSILGVLTGTATITRSGTADTATSQFTTADALAFNGILRLRGSTPSTNPGAMQGGTGRFWLNSSTGSQLAGTKFFLDTGDSPTNGQDVIIGEWNADATRTLTLSGLQGYGTIRTDAGGDAVRNLIVDQSGGDTVFNGMLLSHRSGGLANRSIAFEKKGTSKLTMAGIVGAQTASAAGVAPLTVTVSAGTLALTASNTYTGDTTVSGTGILELADNAQLKFVLGATSGTNNSISGSGTATLDGDFVIDTTAADALETGTWTLENVNTLTGPYSSTFSVIGFTDAGNNKWTKPNGLTKIYTFDETTGVLTLGTVGYSAWAATNAPGQTIDQDHDGDGVPNGVEYFMGLGGSGFTPNPAPDASGLISWPKGASYAGTYGTDYAIQTSSDLGITDPWADVPVGNVVIDGDSVDYDLDTAPAGAKKFARIKVSGP